MDKTKKLIEKSIEVHTHPIDNLSYEKVEYVNSKTHIIVSCHNKYEDGTEHGDFKITPQHLIDGQGCPICRYLKSSSKKRRSIKDIIEESRSVHRDKYDYSLVTDYKNDRIPYKIICPIHGVFEQTFNRHIQQKSGCPICGRIKCDNVRKLTIDEFIYKATLKHGKTYDYTKTDLNNRDEKRTCYYNM